MKKALINIVLLVMLASSVNGQESGYNALQKVVLQDEYLESFVKEYIDSIRTTQRDGVFSLYIYYKGESYSNYEVMYEGFWENNRISPLAYSTIDTDIILIYSGLEAYFPSKKRASNLLSLLQGKIEFVNEKDLTPSIDVPNGKLSVCGEDRVIVEEIDFGLLYAPCVIELPPLDEEN